MKEFTKKKCKKKLVGEGPTGEKRGEKLGKKVVPREGTSAP